MEKYCINCINFINLNPNKNIWYNHLCRKYQFPKDVNPINGKIEPYRQHKDKKYFQKQEYEYCRDINKSCQCKEYEKNLFMEYLQTITEKYKG